MQAAARNQEDIRSFSGRDELAELAGPYLQLPERELLPFECKGGDVLDCLQAKHKSASAGLTGKVAMVDGDSSVQSNPKQKQHVE